MDKDQEDWEKKRGNYILAAVFCFLLGSYFLINVRSAAYEIKPSDLHIVENTVITEKPVFKETKGKRGRKWIEFKCEKSTATFEIANFDYACVNDDEILNELQTGDTIAIKILETDAALLNRETSCEIHSLVKAGKEYMDIECRNRKDQKDGELGYIICYAITVTTGIAGYFKKKPKIFNEINSDIAIFIIVILLFFAIR